MKKPDSSILTLFILIFLTALLSCSQGELVQEYFQSHGMTYPVDVSGLTREGCNSVGFENEELSTNEAQEYLEEGILFVKVYFQNRKVGSIMPGTEAITVSKPVLYRDESEKGGLMVKVTGYGAGKPDRKISLQSEQLVSKQQIWKVENFAYFIFSNDYEWQFGGWVYQ